MKAVRHKASKALAVFVAAGVAFASCAEAAPVSFKTDVLPVFQNHCVMCHGPGGVGNSSVALDLTGYKQLRSGSLGGNIVIPFHPERSKLVQTIKGNWTSPGALKMPPVGSQLTQAEIAIISDWVKQGAKNN
jgi:mono/diheme cytochrome c family protein